MKKIIVVALCLMFIFSFAIIGCKGSASMTVRTEGNGSSPGNSGSSNRGSNVERTAGQTNQNNENRNNANVDKPVQNEDDNNNQGNGRIQRR